MQQDKHRKRTTPALKLSTEAQGSADVEDIRQGQAEDEVKEGNTDDFWAGRTLAMRRSARVAA